MENTDKFILQDRFGVKMNAEFVMRLNIDENEYMVYNILKDDEYTDVYVGRVIYDANGNETIISIDSSAEEEKIFRIVDTMINKVRWRFNDKNN